MPAIVTMLISYGPLVIGALMAAITAIQATQGSDPNCTGTCETLQLGKAALWAILGYVVKPRNMTGGTVANPSSAIGTIPTTHTIDEKTPVVDPKAPSIPLAK